jgi:2-keto-4-pentenoate hydratase
MADSSALGMPGTKARDARAAAFVDARQGARALEAYPGALPANLAEAYDIQSQAIAAWPDRVAGWKVGRINTPWDVSLGSDRLVGPIFERQVSRANETAAPAYIFTGGFGAVEGEIVFELGSDAPAHKVHWSVAEAEEIAVSAWIGVEIASSPFAEINDHGPLVTISDFGNNNGLILGTEIKAWRSAAAADWQIRTCIDGTEAGAANAGVLPGGPIESLRAALAICAKRGLPLRRGMFVSTGAVTGIHVIRPGQTARIELAGAAPIDCIAKAATGPATHPVSA